MAAPTDVRVEAISITSTVIRWTFPGSGYLWLYRKPDGGAYALITTNILGSLLEYTDTGLAVATKYFYKLSDNAGSTFSSEVSVYTHTCVGPVSTANKPVVLPRFDDAEVASILGDTSQVPGFSTNVSDTTQRMNELAALVEKAFQEKPPGAAVDPCIACPVDGAVVIDCSTGCNNWEIVTADGDNINSVSIMWCNKFDGTIDFIVPPNATVGICGLPSGFGFSGDECFRAPIKGGSKGRRVGVGFAGSGGGGGATASGGGGSSSPGKPGKKGEEGPGSGASGSGSGGGGGSGGGSGCTCTPDADGLLTVRSCTSDGSNSLSCSSSKSLKLVACGGRGPYMWSSTGSVTITVADGGDSVVVTPPANTGSGEAGVAYVTYGGECQNAGGVPNPCSAFQFAVFASQHGCNDQELSACGQVFAGAVSGNCGTVAVNLGLNACSAILACNDGGSCSDGTCDARSAGMIAAGCTPCGVSAGSTVSVTDSLGAVFTKILKA